MAGQHTLILASDYNLIQSIIDQVMNTSSGDYGYGQPVSSSQVAAYAKITSRQWSNLRTDILKARIHQTGANEILTNPTTDTIITEADRKAYYDMAVLCDDNRLISPPASQASRTTIATEAYTASWNGTVTYTTTIDFGTSEAMRFYFNTGGFFDITAARQGGTIGAKNNSWTTMLTNMGTIRFTRENTVRIDTNNNSSTISSVGYSDLSTSNQLLYVKSTENSTYSPNEYRINVKTNTNNSVIIFTIDYADLSLEGIDNSAWGTDEFVDGILTSTIQSYRSTGVNVSVPLPSSNSVYSSSSEGSSNRPDPITPSISFPVSATNDTPFTWGISGGVPNDTWYATTTSPTHPRIPSSGLLALNSSGAYSDTNGSFSPDIGTFNITWYFGNESVAYKSIIVSKPNINATFIHDGFHVGNPMLPNTTDNYYIFTLSIPSDGSYTYSVSSTAPLRSGSDAASGASSGGNYVYYISTPTISGDITATVMRSGYNDYSHSIPYNGGGN